MRLGGESVGRWGLATLIVAGIAGILLAAHGWSVRTSGQPNTTLGASQAPKVTPTTSRSPTAPTASPTPGPSSPSTSDGHRPLLSAQPFASAAFLVWPGTPNAAAQQALIGLQVSVKQQGSALVVTAGPTGQKGQVGSYPGGARVYVVEQSLGDDSGNTDYNLGDDALVVTDSKGGIIR